MTKSKKGVQSTSVVRDVLEFSRRSRKHLEASERDVDESSQWKNNESSWPASLTNQCMACSIFLLVGCKQRLVALSASSTISLD